jgi:hypothetical protein
VRCQIGSGKWLVIILALRPPVSHEALSQCKTVAFLRLLVQSLRSINDHFCSVSLECQKLLLTVKMIS